MDSTRVPGIRSLAVFVLCSLVVPVGVWLSSVLFSWGLVVGCPFDPTS